MNGIFKINEIILDVVVWLPCNRERGEWTYFNFSTLPVLIRYVEVCRASQISDPIARIRRGAILPEFPRPGSLHPGPASPPPGPARGILPPAGIRWARRGSRRAGPWPQLMTPGISSVPPQGRERATPPSQWGLYTWVDKSQNTQ